MKTIKNLSLLVLLSVFVLVSPKAKAQKSEAKPAANGIERIITDLSDKQKDDINTLRTAHIKEAQQLKNQMDIKRAELKALQQVDNPDMDAINKKIEERAALRTDLEKKTASFKQDVRKVLTEEQRVEYDKNSKKGHHGKAHNCGHKQGHSCSKQQQKKCAGK